MMLLNPMYAYTYIFVTSLYGITQSVWKEYIGNIAYHTSDLVFWLARPKCEHTRT